MIIKIVIFILHILCAIIWTVMAATIKNKKLRNLYIVCAVLWYMCAGVDIAQITLLMYT